jgi:CubicO group peptidase (beta-lactamase class C family)
LAGGVSRAEALPRLHALIVAEDGREIVARAFRGPGLDRPANVKSVSKSVMSALVGIAIGKGVIAGTDARVTDLLPSRLPPADKRDPRLAELTVGNLLSMQAGLERTSGVNYGRWVASRDWVRHALSRPFDDAPGGQMLYSTGNTHLLSAILTRASGRSTHTLAEDWLGKPLGIAIPTWQRDPQGIYFGGNNMLLSPRALLKFGELYRNGGKHDGKQVLPAGWVEASWTPRTESRWSGDAYGYGWFSTTFCGETSHYARGFGGQFVHVLPSLALTVVITSDRSARTRVGDYRGELNDLVESVVSATLKERNRSCS